MKDNYDIILTLRISYKAVDLDPNDVAVQIVQQIEKELRRECPMIGQAFSNLISGNTLDWLDIDE